METRRRYPSPGPLNTFKFGIGTRVPVSYARLAVAEIRRASEAATKAVAHRFFTLTQQNIKEMRITDRGMLLRSGYIRRLEDGSGWVVGYTAPYSRYVDEGTGPLAGHPHYRAPPPYENIRDWVARNLQAYGMRSYTKPRKGVERPVRGARFRRLKNPAGGYVYVLKPHKPSPKLIGEFRKAGKSKGDMDEKDRIAKAVQLAIYKHGTKPRPFWRNALARIRAEEEHLERQAYMEGARELLKKSLYRAAKMALKTGLRVGGGGFKSW
jgi:hypothetical protein